MERVTFSLLHQRLVSIGFDGWDAVTEEDVYKGDPHCYAVFMRSILCAFPHVTALFLRKYPWFCIEGDPESLARSVLRLLANECGRRVFLSPMQLKACKYASAKMKICIELYEFLYKVFSSTCDSPCPHTRTQRKEENKSTGDKVVERSAALRLAPLDLSTALLKGRLDKLAKRKRALDCFTRE